MPSHYNYPMDNTVRSGVWGRSNSMAAKEASSTVSAPVSSSGKGSKFAPPDRCCTLCASGLFLPRDMTESNFGDPSADPRGPKEEEERHIAYAKEKLGRFEEEFKFRNEDMPSSQVLPELPLLEMEEVKLGKKFGKGGSATVYEVTGFDMASVEDVDQEHLRQLLAGSFPQKHRYVLKKLSTRFQAALPTNEPYARACAINLVLEAQILRMLDHPNILKLHAMGVNEELAPFLILTCLPESMEERILSWRTEVKKLKKQLATSAASMWRLVSIGGSNKKAYAAHLKLRKALWERMHVSRDIALAVEHMHSQGIIYRDLKCSNIGFDSSGVVKIFDFGISRFLPKTVRQPSQIEAQENFLMSKAGTRMYMAPEIMAGKSYNFKADVYSFGVIFWQLLSIATPKPLDSEEYPLFDFKMCACWPSVTQELVGSLLELDPTHRPSITDAHKELTQQLERLKRAFMQQDAVPVLTKKKRGFGRAGTFELSTDLDMP